MYRADNLRRALVYRYKFHQDPRIRLRLPVPGFPLRVLLHSKLGLQRAALDRDPPEDPESAPHRLRSPQVLVPQHFASDEPRNLHCPDGGREQREFGTEYLLRGVPDCIRTGYTYTGHCALPGVHWNHCVYLLAIA